MANKRIIKKLYDKTLNTKNSLDKKELNKEKIVIFQNPLKTSMNTFSADNWLHAYTVENILGSYNESVVY